MNYLLRFISALTILLCLSHTTSEVLAQSSAGGTITGTTTWTTGESPVTVTDSVIVEEGATLTVEPGVEVRFEQQNALIVEGTLEAEGTDIDPILFTSAAGTSAPGDWASITFANPNNVGSVFDHVVVEYGGYGTTNGNIYYESGVYGVAVTNAEIRESDGHGINVRASSPVLNELSIENNDGYGVFSDTFSNFELYNSFVSNNATGGVRVPVNAEPTISDNTIQDNDIGIYNDEDAVAEITGNDILDNRIGIHIEELGSTLPEIQNNAISGNSEYGLRNATTAARYVNAERNFWGDDSGPYHSGTNPTGNGDRVSDYVEYDPWNIEDDDLTVTEVTTNITEDTTWDEGVYWVKNDISIDTGITLTIQPGVVVKLAEGVEIEARNGSINAQGTEEETIVFTSENDDSYGGNTNDDPTSIPEPGDWRRIDVRTSTSIFEHAMFRFGGSSLGALYIRDATPTINDVYISRNSNSGIYFFTSDITPISMDNIVLTGNNGPGIDNSGSHQLHITNSRFAENQGYAIESSSREGTIELLENSVVERNQSGGIYNTSAEGGQTFRDNEITDNRGHGFFIENANEQILFEDNFVAENDLDGIVTSSAQFVANEIRNNRYPIGVTYRLGYDYTDDQDVDDNIIEDNKFDNAISAYTGIEGTLDTVFPESIPEPVYVAVERLTVNEELVVDPGVIVKFEDGNRLLINGRLEAIGTEQDPIVFTSWRDDTKGGWTHDTEAEANPESGDWNRIELRSGSSNDSRLEHVVMHYGSYNLFIRPLLNEPIRHLESRYASNNGVYMRNNAQVTIEESTISDNDDEGIYLTGSDVEAIVRVSEFRNNEDGLYADNSSAFREISNSIIEENLDYGIYVSDATIPQTITGNTIADNGNYGVWLNNTTAEPQEVQFIGNTISGSSKEGVVSSRARFIDNDFIDNRYPIGVTDKLGNLYVDSEGNDGNTISENQFNNAIAVYSGIEDTLSTVFPEAMPEPVYVAVERLTVSAELVIDPGVIFKFEDGNRLRVTGRLEAIGTEQNPIVFTSWRDDTQGGWTHDTEAEANPEPGDWDRLELRSGSSNDTRLEHVVMHYGSYNLFIRAALNEPVRHLESRYASNNGVYMRNNARVTFEESIVSNNSDEGFYLTGSDVEASIRSSEVRNNDEGLYATNNSAFREISNSIIEDNHNRGVYVGEASIPQTIAGNQVSGNDGNGLNINSFNNDVDTLLVINNNDVTGNNGVGIFASRAHVTDNTVNGNEFALGVQEQLSLENSGNEEGFVYSGNNLGDNTYPANAILMGSSIYGKIGHSLPEQIDEPVFVTLNNHISVDSDHFLDIAPGSVFKLDDQRMEINGELTAAGTAEEKIIFTSWKDDSYGGDTNADSTDTVPQPGDWRSLRIYGEAHNDSYMNNVMVRYGSRNLRIRDNDIVIDSLYASNSDNEGVRIRDASPTINYSEIHNNPTGIYVTRDSDPTIRQSNIRDNENYGLDHDSDGTTMATNNYWGHEKGPFMDDRNLDGEGDVIREQSGTVEFYPWLTDRTGVLLGDVSESGVISAYDASLVLQFLVGSISLSGEQQEAADVSGSGDVSAMDASYILQFVVGKISGFPGMGRLAPEEQIAEGIEIDTEHTDHYQDLYINLTGELDVYASELHLDYNRNLVGEVEWIDTSGEENLTFEQNDEDGSFKIAAASSEAFTGSGEFTHVRLHLNQDANFSGQDLFSMEKFHVNEYDLTAQFEDRFTSISEELTDIPEEFDLGINYPNPFNPVTTIPYQMPVSGEVNITIYNSVGQQVQTLEQTDRNPGYYEVQWDASNVSSGVYMYRIEIDSEEAGAFTDVGKMILVK